MNKDITDDLTLVAKVALWKRTSAKRYDIVSFKRLIEREGERSRQENSNDYGDATYYTGLADVNADFEIR